MSYLGLIHHSVTWREEESPRSSKKGRKEDEKGGEDKPSGEWQQETEEKQGQDKSWEAWGQIWSYKISAVKMMCHPVLWS